MSEASSRGRVRFGVFEADLRSGELRKNGSKIRLQAQPFQVLALLIERRGETVTREEIRAQLWSADTFVDFDHGLNKVINKIREALGDSAASPRFVETVARRGYRFLADVAEVEDVVETPVAAPEAPSPHRPPSRWFAVVLGGLALAVAALLVLASARTSTGRASPTVRSLAVLPLENLSADPSQEYFADGMTDELIATLGQIGDVRVISRTSVMPFKRVRKPLPEIARELKVDAIVEGTVLRSNGQVRITAQLIDARSDAHLWADTYQGDPADTLALQHKVARAIADRIQVTLNPQAKAAWTHERALDPDAHEAYLKGRYFWNKRTAEGLTAARDYFDRAIARDQGYAQAYSGLADTYALLGDWQYAVMPPSAALPKAKAAAMKAIELDEGLGEAHTSLGFCLDGFDWDFATAEREFRRGIELNPSYATAHHWYAWHLSLIGRDRDALAEMRQAQTLDPLSLIINADLAELLLIAHRPDESIQQSRKTIEMDPGFALAHNQLGQAYLQKGLPEAAIAELQQAAQGASGSATSTANLARAYAASGRRQDAMQLLTELQARARPGSSNAPDIAAIYVALGDHDQGISWLNKAFDERFNPGVLLRPGFDPLRADRRFQALIKRVGLSQ